ncbi:MAG: Ig-like domain-containing protein [Chitinophagaceae bacterium]
MKKPILLLAVLFFTTSVFTQTVLISYGSSWKYLANGTNQGTAWRASSFNDASWLSGNAQLGYGDGDEATVVSYGSNASNKYTTTYFRRSISVANAAVYTSFTISLKRDDGAIVYINGVERFRSNMPIGTISYTTKAAADAADDGNTAQTISLAAGILTTGTNVIAVEVHQRTASSSDISFDLQLTAAGDVTAPTVSTYSPADNATNITPATNLVLAFSESIQKGTGNILVKEGGVVTQTIDVTSTSVTVAGNTVTIDATDFTNSADVNIEIAAGTFKDLSNNNYGGITNATTWNFKIIDLDVTSPIVSNYSPADNSINTAINSNLVLTFSETVQKGSGNILIKEGGITTQTIDVTSATVTVSGNTVTVNPSDFTNSAAVNIEISAGAFKDLANNNYAGITDAFTWNFNTATPPSGPQTLVTFGTSWKYLDKGTNQGTAWKATSFNDASWATGNAQLGYGDGDEATVVSYGPSSTAKYITTYFRKTISVSNPLNFSSILGSVKRDDGIAIYLNGTEVYRNNLTAGAGYTTLATLASDDGATAQTFSFSPSSFVSGTNVIAVEIHQNAANSTDISFDLQLIGTVPNAALLTRGPYLNMGNETAVTLRWKTDMATNSKVEVGTSFGSYTNVFNNSVSSTEHEVRVTGLNPDTKYFYRFGSSTLALQQGTDNYFITAPQLSATRKIRIAAFGDCGRNDNLYQSSTLSSYQNYIGNNRAEVLLLLGDNAYETGTDSEYQSRFFDIYSSNILKNHQLFPAPGNHDYANNVSRQADHNIPYNSIFSNPTAAECGGVPSGTEAYYSWNWGNIHFLSLDSYGKENAGTTRLYDTTGAQAVWVKNDLAANTRPWVIAYWHHPPFTMGSHNSDSETELINMRQNFIRILERYGVDVIVCGHSHDYERSYLLKNYFGTEASFNPATHAASTSSGKYDGSTNSCPYLLAPGKVNHGTVYIVSGSAGANGGIQTGYPHNAMPWSVNDGGMMYFEVEGNRLDAKFIRRTGVVFDQFTIMKDAGKTTNLSVNSGAATTLTASWNGNYSWSTGETSKSITVVPVANSSYTVSDGTGCVNDIFNVTINSGLRRSNIPVAVDSKPLTSLNMIPSFVKKGVSINVQATGIIEAAVVDVSGRVIKIYKFNGSFSIETNQLHHGVYFLRYRDSNSKIQAKKFVVTD